MLGYGYHLKLVSQRYKLQVWFIRYPNMYSNSYNLAITMATVILVKDFSALSNNSGRKAIYPGTLFTKPSQLYSTVSLLLDLPRIKWTIVYAHRNWRKRCEEGPWIPVYNHKYLIYMKADLGKCQFRLKFTCYHNPHNGKIQWRALQDLEILHFWKMTYRKRVSYIQKEAGQP